MNASLYKPEQLNWLRKAEKFADAISFDAVVQSDNENVFRRDLFQDACAAGFGALPFASGWGGGGGDYVSFCLVNEEFGKRCVPIMSPLGVHILCQEPIYKFGSEEQKRKYLPPSSSGQFLAAFALTEPGAGSDTANLQAKARSVGDEYILNGSKIFITGGAAADYFIVMAHLDDAGISSFIVESGFSGFTVGQKFDMLGMRGCATCEIVFADCRIPKNNLLGQPGWGRRVALSSLAKGRVTIAAQATGWAQGALTGAVRAIEAETKDDPEHKKKIDTLSPTIGDLACLVESARVLTYRAAQAIDSGDSDNTLAGMAKLQATDVAMQVSTQALSLVSDFGIQPDFLLSKIFRDAKAGQIYEGTNQIQRLLIARGLSKK